MISNEEQPLSITFPFATLWIKAYNLPFKCMNEAITRLIAERVGELIRVDKHEIDHGGKFIRFKAKIRDKESLFRGITT